MYAAHIVNRAPHAALGNKTSLALRNKTLFKLLHSEDGNLAHVCTIYGRSYTSNHAPRRSRTKPGKGSSVETGQTASLSAPTIPARGTIESRNVSLSKHLRA